MFYPQGDFLLERKREVANMSGPGMLPMASMSSSVFATTTGAGQPAPFGTVENPEGDSEDDEDDDDDDDENDDENDSRDFDA
ncbi:hypothetical protein BGW38_009825, partial [Lunasporangiospora selenospora]